MKVYAITLKDYCYSIMISLENTTIICGTQKCQGFGAADLALAEAHADAITRRAFFGRRARPNHGL
jgi:hypothetical protein